MSDVEYVGSDNDVQSVASFNSIDEFTMAGGNGTIWSLNDTGEGQDDASENGKKVNVGGQTTGKIENDVPNHGEKAEPNVLQILLAECESYYKTEMKKAEQKIMKQMLNGIKLDTVENNVDTATVEKPLHNVCKCKKLSEKVEKLRFQLKTAKLLAVPKLKFSTNSVDFIGVANRRTTISIANFGPNRVAVHAYLATDLFASIRVNPVKMQIANGELRSVDLVWTGQLPTNTRSVYNGPLTFSFRWTNVPETAPKDENCPLVWMNEYPTRQHQIFVKL